MKVLIFSDSHGDVETMRGVTVREQPDRIIHLGDHIADAEQLGAQFAGIPMIAVLGNTDSRNENEQWVRWADLCGRRVLLTHGHTFDVIYSKDGIRNLSQYGTENEADIILFGHSHEPFLHCVDGVWIMNPGRVGRVSRNRIHATYGVLMIESDSIKWTFKEVDP